MTKVSGVPSLPVGNGNPFSHTISQPSALVANNRILTTESAIAFQFRALKQPMLWSMNLEGCRSIHELAMTFVVTAPQKANPVSSFSGR